MEVAVAAVAAASYAAQHTQKHRHRPERQHSNNKTQTSRVINLHRAAKFVQPTVGHCEWQTEKSQKQKKLIHVVPIS